MKTKIFLLMNFLLLGFSYSASAQTWTNVTNPLPWAAGNNSPQSMVVYGDNLYVGTYNSGGAEVWRFYPQPAVTAVPIPTMTDLGMMILVILLGIGSIYYLRRSNFKRILQ